MSSFAARASSRASRSAFIAGLCNSTLVPPKSVRVVLTLDCQRLTSASSLKTSVGGGVAPPRATSIAPQPAGRRWPTSSVSSGRLNPGGRLDRNFSFVTRLDFFVEELFEEAPLSFTFVFQQA